MCKISFISVSTLVGGMMFCCNLPNSSGSFRSIFNFSAKSAALLGAKSKPGFLIVYQLAMPPKLEVRTGV